VEIDYYNEYLRHKQAGISRKTKEAVMKFIHSFENYAEKESWVMDYLSKPEYDSNGRIRNELFEEIIFPVLLNGYANKNVPLMIWLVKLNQNYYQNHRIWEKINYKTTLEIIMECYQLEPDNNEVTDMLLEVWIEQINFNIHEWPHGVLWGNSFATKDECISLLERVKFINRLDRDRKYSACLNDYENKVKEYMERKE
jgi:RAB protein geranylgeranyltransferase component A